MSDVLRGEGAGSLVEVCTRTIFEPEILFGVVALSEPLTDDPAAVAAQVDLAGLAASLREAWAQAGYPGRPSDFRMGRISNRPVGVHIDQKAGPGANSPERLVVLSMGLVGLAQVYGKGYPAAVKPGDDSVDRQSLRGMRYRAGGQSKLDLPTTFVHRPNEIIVIPTLPNPTAHAVDLIDPDRTTMLWDCVLAFG